MEEKTYTGFVGFEMVAAGPLPEVAAAVRAAVARGQKGRVVVIDDQTGRSMDTDGLEQEICVPATAPLEESVERVGPGRPRLGVVSREVSLLPRHWDWLNEQPRGASATIRILVEEARRKNAKADEARRKRDAIHRVLWDMAGNLPGFEEATRSFFARDYDGFWKNCGDWPKDFLAYLKPRIEALATTELESDGSGATT